MQWLPHRSLIHKNCYLLYALQQKIIKETINAFNVFQQLSFNKFFLPKAAVTLLIGCFKKPLYLIP